MKKYAIEIVKLNAGEAEELVKQIRAHLRLAQNHSEQGNKADEEKEIKKSHELFERLWGGSIYIMEVRAKSVFGLKSHIHFDDLVEEMALGLLKEVQRTEASLHTLFYEQNFKVALKGCIDNVIAAFNSDKAGYKDSFTRAHRRQEKQKQEVAEGKRASRSDAQDVEVPLSLNAPTGDDENIGDLAELVADKASLDAIDNVLIGEVRQALLAESSAQDAVFAEALFRQYSFEEAAEKAGLPLRTAFDRKKKIYKRLCELLGISMESGGVVDEAASEFAKPTTKTRAKGRTPRVH